MTLNNTPHRGYVQLISAGFHYKQVYMLVETLSLPLISCDIMGIYVAVGCKPMCQILVKSGLGGDMS